MTKFNQELERAQEVVRGLQRELEEKIIGQKKEAWKCWGSGMECYQLEAFEVTPTYLSMSWSPGEWKVRAKDKGEEKILRLGDFLPEKQIKNIFDKYLVGIDLGRIGMEWSAREKAKMYGEFAKEDIVRANRLKQKGDLEGYKGAMESAKEDVAHGRFEMRNFKKKLENRWL